MKPEAQIVPVQTCMIDQSTADFFLILNEILILHGHDVFRKEGFPMRHQILIVDIVVSELVQVECVLIALCKMIEKY